MGRLESLVELFQFFGPVAEEMAVGDENLVVVIVHQERLQHVLLVPGLAALEDPRMRVFLRQRNVVQMDDHARLQAREDFEKEPVHIAANFGTVGTVVEQHITSLQLVENFKRRALQHRAVDFPGGRKVLEEP